MYVHHSQYMHFCRYTLLLSILLSIIAAPIQAADKLPPGNIILSDGTMIGIDEQKPITLSEYPKAFREMLIQRPNKASRSFREKRSKQRAPQKANFRTWTRRSRTWGPTPEKFR